MGSWPDPNNERISSLKANRQTPHWYIFLPIHRLSAAGITSYSDIYGRILQNIFLEEVEKLKDYYLCSDSATLYLMVLKSELQDLPFLSVGYL